MFIFQIINDIIISSITISYIIIIYLIFPKTHYFFKSFLYHFEIIMVKWNFPRLLIDVIFHIAITSSSFFITSSFFSLPFPIFIFTVFSSQLSSSLSSSWSVITVIILWVLLFQLSVIMPLFIIKTLPCVNFYNHQHLTIAIAYISSKISVIFFIFSFFSSPFQFTIIRETISANGFFWFRIIYIFIILKLYVIFVILRLLVIFSILRL